MLKGIPRQCPTAYGKVRPESKGIPPRGCQGDAFGLSLSPVTLMPQALVYFHYTILLSKKERMLVI